MDLFSTLSDDQIALIGCAAAFVVATFLMTVSYYVGQRGQNRENTREQILTAARQNAESMNKAA